MRLYRHRINTILKTSTTDKAVAAKANLRKELTAWRIIQFERFPSLHTHITDLAETVPEKEKLLLPSEFPQHMRSALGLEELTKAEYALREGEAHDSLADVRLAIKTFNFNVAFKIAQIQGQSANTRAQNFLRTLANDRIVAADAYRRARAALVNLGLPEADKTLKPLVNDELWAKNTRDMPKMGESKMVDPWIWTVGRPANLSAQEAQEWSVERE